MLRCDEVLYLNLPSLPTRVHLQPPHRPLVRHQPISSSASEPEEATENGSEVTPACKNAAVNSDLSMADVLQLENHFLFVEGRLVTAEI